jgi:thiol-disulfide isomerase/thioredoxin
VSASLWLDSTEFKATVLLQRSRFRSWWMGSALGAALAMLCAAPDALAADAAARHPLIGRPAPEIVQRLFVGPGRNFRLSERRGDVVVVGFWTSWCGSCRTYLQRLARLDATYAQAGLVVIGISLDDDAARATSLAGAVGVKFRNGVDTEKVLGRRFAVPDVPLTLLIDRAGIVRFAHGELDPAADAELVTELRQLLDE